MSDKMPAFLDKVQDKEEITEDTLQRLKNLADSYFALEQEVAEKEEVFKQTKSLFTKLTQETIPEFLSQYGLSEIKLKSGEKIKVNEDLSVSIPQEKKDVFFKFLKSRNEEDIIKLQVFFDKMPTEKLRNLIAFMNSNQYEYDVKRDVHPQTMKKYFKEILGFLVDEDDRKHGIKNGKYLRTQDIADFANVFQLRKTKIKK